jgi:tetrahydromethanopterin S-methyltransferase subunit G
MNEQTITQVILKEIQPLFKEQQIFFEHFAMGVSQEFEKVNGRLDGIDGRLDGIDGRLDRIDGRLDGVEGRLDKNERDIAFLKHEVVQNGDALARLTKTMDSELAAAWSHIKRLDRRPGLAS